MFRIEIFEDNKGESTVLALLKNLEKKSKTEKRSRIELNKILEYIQILQDHGTYAGSKFVKHIVGDIWELRPQSNRIFFFITEYFSSFGPKIRLFYFTVFRRKHKKPRNEE